MEKKGTDAVPAADDHKAQTSQGPGRKGSKGRALPTVGAGADASIAGVSFFTGIGGFDLGFERAGITTLLQCEIDANCRALLARKFPHATRLPDVRAIAAVHRRMRKGKPGPNYDFWKRIFDLLRNAAVWDGGFPCQDLSLAGARAGLAGERSGLWFAVRRLAAIFRPGWLVLENVPGLLSSQEGRDFDTVLRGLEELGYRWAYRVLDAQFFGVAQRRERVFIVANLGTSRGRRSGNGIPEVGESRGVRCLPEEVLFEPESVCWDNPPSREAREGVAAKSLCSSDGGVDREDRHTLIPEVAWCLQERDAKGADSDTKPGHLLPIPFDTTQITHPENRSKPKAGDPSPTLAKSGHSPCVAFSGKDYGADATDDLSPTLRAMPHRESHANGGGQVAVAFAGVRRLTPRECERLQDFPDDWTAGFSDSTRYRMLGNAVNVACSEWIGHRLAAAIKRERPC